MSGSCIVNDAFVDNESSVNLEPVFATVFHIKAENIRALTEEADS